MSIHVTPSIQNHFHQGWNKQWSARGRHRWIARFGFLSWAEAPGQLPSNCLRDLFVPVLPFQTTLRNSILSKYSHPLTPSGRDNISRTLYRVGAESTTSTADKPVEKG